MTATTTFDRIVDLISPFVRRDGSNQTITPESRLIDDLKVNSARMVDIILELEDAFSISISDAEADAVTSAGELAALVERKTA